MHEILSGSSGKVLGIKVSGKLSHADYEGFVPKIEEIIKKHGSVRVLFEMVDFGGMEAGAVWDEMKFDAKHASQIERCAVVGDRKWQEWMVSLSKPFFFRSELRFFPIEESEKAWSWIRQGA